MPLIIITGIPNSGKSTRTEELKNYFQKNYGKKVNIISEIHTVIKAGYDRNTFYSDSKKEKAVRNDIRSSTQHLLNTTDVLIIDGSNYIKGYRYELYCLSKSFKTPQCTVHCDIPVEHAWLLNKKKPDNEKYSREIFDALVMRQELDVRRLLIEDLRGKVIRELAEYIIQVEKVIRTRALYESPDNKNRWDSPLFAVTADDVLPFDEIHKSLYLVKPPKPNMSTQTPPVSSTNYLYELDRISQEIISEIITAEKIGITRNIKLGKFNLIVERGANAAQLNRLRRQFLSINKILQIENNEIPQLFVKYLNTNL